MITVEFHPWMQWAITAAGLGLVYSCLCRARWMTKATTLAPMRYATTALAGAGFTLPIVAFLRPDWLPGALLALSLAALGTQAVSAHLWRGGLPLPFTKRGRHAEHFMQSVRSWRKP
ncbi:hypothetical protein [Roseateles depolymerans]|uniref:Uncharacterized protein n=1 Tax=Roseateles depolymerans TaxID=76731 RepID=A0A0U3LP58_9BURK|nr:hypothetical protein [Roseateles depolymerans]ALV06711.1 hypothetical protein RD2015_2239 [Roseateles depolymerans]REG19688.1 hypothetical protein DES44_2188 [Roseateles depolymerans]